MNTENCVKIIMILLLGLAGYIIIIVGMMSICFQKVFVYYNNKLDNINNLLSELQVQVQLKEEKIKIKKQNKGLDKSKEVFV
jgi:hypothetical protein